MSPVGDGRTAQQPTQDLQGAARKARHTGQTGSAVNGRHLTLAALIALSVLIALPFPARAQGPTPPNPNPVVSGTNGDVGFDQRLDNPVPLELVWHDERGQFVRLGDYFGDKPVILTLNYLHCANLCPRMLEELTRSLRAVTFSVGHEFNVVTVSVDPHETPALARGAKQELLARYARPGAEDGWHILTGDDLTIRALANAVGFRYVYDVKAHEYAHPLGIVVLTPQGKVSRYLYGLDLPARDIQLALLDAAQNQIGSPTDHLLTLCFRYDPAAGKYSSLALDAARWAGVATVIGLGMFLAVLWRKEFSLRKT